MPTSLNVVIAIDPFNVQNGEYLVKLSYEGKSVAQEQIRIDRKVLLQHEYQFTARNYGMELYGAVFTGAVGREYQRLVGRAGAQELVRVQLEISRFAQELHALPWERLFHVFGDVDAPLAASAQTPFSRFLVTGAADQPPIASLPLRLLVAMANPTNLPAALAALDIVGEIRSLADLLGGLRGQVAGTLMPGITQLPDGLRGQLQQEGWKVVDGVTSWKAIQQNVPGQHVLHILAHGQFRSDEKTAYLLLEDEGSDQIARGALHRVADQEIVDGLAGVYPRPQLVFLAACDSAKRLESDANPFVGLAPRLVAAGVPAVVAMQDKVPIQLAHTVAVEFYRRLFDYEQVDRALNEARSLVLSQQGFEWAIPVLFLRLQNGYLFRKEPVTGLVDIGTPPKSEQLRQALQSLNYAQQWEVFNRFLTRSSQGAFILSGPSRSGQVWLLKRLVSRLADRTGEHVIIRMNPERTTQSITVQVFWELLAIEIGMAIDSSKQALAQQLSDVWRLKHIFFVLTDVKDYLLEIHEFWQELMQAIGQSPPAKKWLLLFMVNEAGPLPSQLEIRTVTVCSDEWSPQEAVRLPELAESFDQSDVFGWLVDHKGDLALSELHSQIEDDIRTLFDELWEESEHGMPMSTLRVFYDRCVPNSPRRWPQVKKEWTAL